MLSPARHARALLDRRVPARTRLALMAADARRSRAPRDLYAVRYGRGTVYFSHADYTFDRKSFDFAVVEGSYATDYVGAVVLDLGAHKGYYAAYVVTRGARAVVTYEPESTNMAILERTASSYRDVDWTTRHAAVDATSGRADLHVMGASWGHALTPPTSFTEHEVGIESVEVVALADALTETSALALGSRLVVKVNIEGAECSAILGSPAQVWEHVSEVFVETHPWASCDGSSLAAHIGSAGLIRVESAHPAVLRMRRAEQLRSG